MLQLIRRMLGREKSQLPPFDFSRNRFPAKKHWPPNLRKLTEKQQFRFERKFKRRLRNKSIKPEWQRWTKIVQWNLIGFVVVYGVLFHDFAKDPMNPAPGEQPFNGLRQWMWNIYGGFWTHTIEEGEKSRMTAPRQSVLRREEREGRADLERSTGIEADMRQWTARK